MRYFTLLVHGDAQITIATGYRMSPSVVSRVIKHTSKVIWDVLFKRKFVDPPKDCQSWMQVAKEFNHKWNFPHCLGAIDGACYHTSSSTKRVNVL